MSRVSPSVVINRISVTCVYAVTLIALWFSVSPVIFESGASAQNQDYNLLNMSYVARIKKPAPKAVISGKPFKISIPSIGLNKTIEDGVYNSEQSTWTLYGKSIHYALLSAPANDFEGNTLLYGHNNKNVFGNLKKIQVGDKVDIITDNNKIFTYKFSEKTDFSPTDTSIFDYSGTPLLTLQTCSGRFNEIRSLYMFKFESVEDYLSE